MNSKKPRKEPASSIEQETQSIESRYGCSADEANLWQTIYPKGKKDRLTLPRLDTKLCSLLTGFKVTEYQVLLLAGSNSAAPLLAEFKRECLDDIDNYAILQNDFSSSDRSVEDVKIAARRIVQLCHRPLARRSQFESNGAFVVCAKYTQHLFNKNEYEFFARAGFSKDEALLLCATLLFVMFCDIETDSKGFFATLLGSHRAKPMQSAVRADWEAAITCPTFDEALKEASNIPGEAEVTRGLELLLPSRPMEETTAQQIEHTGLASGLLKPPVTTSTPDEQGRLQSRSDANGTTDDDFTAVYRSWLDEKQRLDSSSTTAAPQDMSLQATQPGKVTVVPLEKGVVQRDGKKGIARRIGKTKKPVFAPDLPKPTSVEVEIPDLLTSGSSIGQKGTSVRIDHTPPIVHPDDATQVFRYKAEIDEDDFNLKEQFAFITAYQDQVCCHKKGGIFQWNEIAAVLPLRSVKDCVQYYYKYHYKIRTEGKNIKDDEAMAELVAATYEGGRKKRNRKELEDPLGVSFELGGPPLKRITEENLRLQGYITSGTSLIHTLGSHNTDVPGAEYNPRHDPAVINAPELSSRSAMGAVEEAAHLGQIPEQFQARLNAKDARLQSITTDLQTKEELLEGKDQQIRMLMGEVFRYQQQLGKSGDKLEQVDVGLQKTTGHRLNTVHNQQLEPSEIIQRVELAASKLAQDRAMAQLLNQRAVLAKAGGSDDSDNKAKVEQLELEKEKMMKSRLDYEKSLRRGALEQLADKTRELAQLRTIYDKVVSAHHDHFSEKFECRMNHRQTKRELASTKDQRDTARAEAQVARQEVSRRFSKQELDLEVKNKVDSAIIPIQQDLKTTKRDLDTTKRDLDKTKSRLDAAQTEAKAMKNEAAGRISKERVRDIVKDENRKLGNMYSERLEKMDKKLDLCEDAFNKHGIPIPYEGRSARK